MFKQYFTEAVIVPEKLKIKSGDLDELNARFNKDKIFFVQGDDTNPIAVHGYYDPSNKEIHIKLPMNVNLGALEASLGHELLHKEQDVRSKGNYGEWIKTYGTKINKYVHSFNKGIKDGTATPDLEKKIEQMTNVFLYGSPYEQMAYAYQFVKGRNVLGFKSPQDIFNHLKGTQIPVTKRFKKYVAGYWLIKDNI